MRNDSKVDLKDYKTKVPCVDMQWAAIGSEFGVYGVFQYAMKKYGNCASWKNKDADSLNRYKSALLRHLFKMLNGEVVDPESGHLHSAHLAWNALTVLQFEIEDKLKNIDKETTDRVLSKSTKIDGLIYGGKITED